MEASRLHAAVKSEPVCGDHSAHRRDMRALFRVKRLREIPHWWKFGALRTPPTLERQRGDLAVRRRARQRWASRSHPRPARAPRPPHRRRRCGHACGRGERHVHVHVSTFPLAIWRERAGFGSRAGWDIMRMAFVAHARSLEVPPCSTYPSRPYPCLSSARTPSPSPRSSIADFRPRVSRSRGGARGGDEDGERR